MNPHEKLPSAPALMPAPVIGRRPLTRRGSFLVLVVGTLAMLSIIMIVYVAIGNSDKRTSVSIARRARSEEVVKQFADYVSQIVADDAVMMAPDASNGSADGSTTYPVRGGNLFVREAWDAPVTNWFANSTKSLSAKGANTLPDPSIFRPAGIGDDPWLASTTPTWLNYQPTSVYAAANYPSDGSGRAWAKRRDWLHISNIAPDGRFVNLFNLRDNFDAKSGTSTAANDRRLNSSLTLLDTNMGASAQSVWGDSANADFPAFFDSWQLNAFRPAKGPFNPVSEPPDQPNYPPYQWADADGDGWFDSRWFEMTDARGEPSLAPINVRNLLPTDPNYRWFFAARIIDLSSLVNINAAGDLFADPNDSNVNAGKMPRKLDVIGTAPTDIDLRKLLTMADSYESVCEQKMNPLAPPSSVVAIADVLANGAPVNRQFHGGYGAIRQPANGFPASQDYTKHVADLSSAGLQPITGFPAVTKPMSELGRGSYRSLRGSVAAGGPTGRFSNFTSDPLKTQALPFQTIRERSTFFTEIAAPTNRAIYDSASQRFAFNTGFAIDNLVELLTFRGNNDSRVTSSLELAAGGHFEASMANAPTINDPLNPFSPLRENRSTELEREGLADANGKPTDAALLKSYIDVRQYLTTHSGARPIIGAFNLSSYTGANPELPPDLTASADVAIYIGDNNASSAPNGASLFKGYAAALAPGLGLTGVWKKPDLGSDARSLRGLFYGHQGPVTALLAAGQMAANVASSGNTGHLPYTLVLTEEVFQNANNRLPEDINYQAAPGSGYTGWQKWFPSWWVGKQYQLNLARSPANTPRSGTQKLSETIAADPVPAPAVKLYGMGDAHPFLVEVASFTTYIDAFPRAGTNGFRDVWGDIEIDSNQQPYVTIRGNLDAKNDDFMFRVLAIKLHNPYAQAITLSKFTEASAATGSAGSVAVNSMEDFFYIRVGESKTNGARYYVLAETVEDQSSTTDKEYQGTFKLKPLTILPGETIVFYAMSQDSKEISQQRINYRVRKPTSISDLSGILLDAWLDKQLGKTATGAPDKTRRVEMIRADDKFENDAAQLSGASFMFDQLVPNAGKDQTVSLYRAVRAKNGTALPDDTSGPNVIANDRLCDRMRLGVEVNLDRQLTNTGGDLQNPTYSKALSLMGLPVLNDPDPSKQDYPAPKSGPTGWNYNSRYMVTLSALARRKADPDGATLKPGQFPAWAIDPKEEPVAWYDAQFHPAVKQAPEKGPISMDGGSDTDAGTKKTFANFTSRDWVTDVQGSTVEPIYPSLPKRAQDLTENVLAASNKNGVQFKQLRHEIAFNNLKYQGVDTNGTAPDGVSQLRLGDLASVMAVGSMEVPFDKTGSELTDPMKRWTTTAEAMAIAFGYSDKAKFDDWANGGSKFGPLDFYLFDQVNSPPKQLFDGGYLRIDSFVAGRYDPSDDTKFFPSSMGAPIAGGLFASLKTQSDSFAGLAGPTFGLVNINTAPQAVLRVLPMAFPAVDPLSGKTIWVGTDDATRYQNAQQTDIAAMIESYRDKIPVLLRAGARDPAANAKAWYAPFFDRSQADFAAGTRIKPTDSKIGDPTQSTVAGGRYWTSGIKGIREGAGLHSLGELLALRAVQVDTNGSVIGGTDFRSNIDVFANLNSAPNFLGLDNVVEQTVDTSSASSPKITDVKPLQFTGAYQDKLKVLSGMLGSISVRSDMYAAWFIVRGYQRSDVEGLPANQPMVPSIERRFLMIIDRSNVTKVGQKPRILAFVEVPL
ncbi:MAG: hypothetical protein U0570_06785 [Phycisphaerales bacterium]